MQHAGKITAFEYDAKEEGLGLTFEYTLPGTPQQNGKVERKLTTLMGRAQAVMNMAGLNGELQQGLWTEAVNHVTMLNNGMYISELGKTPYEMMIEGGKPKYMRDLMPFGQKGIVTYKEGMTKTKIENKKR